MKCIVAAAADWGIGKDGDLLARNKEDMKFFKETTTGHIVVMGRKTLDSFPGGRVLPNRENIVITRDKSFEREGAIVVHSVKEAIAKANELESASEKEIFVIGGDSIYQQMLPQCTTAYVTKMDQTYDADTYFPNLDEDEEWELSEQSEVKEYPDGTFTFCTYVRK